MPAQQREALYAAVNDCDRMLLQCQVDNDHERSDHHKDERRLARYERRRDALVAHRNALQQVFIALYGDDPWANIPY